MSNREAAIKFFNQGVAASTDKSSATNPQTAYGLFVSACHADTTWSHSHFQMGNRNSDIELVDSAIACWRKALTLQQTPKERSDTLTNLAYRLHGLGKVAEAKAMTEEALTLDTKQHNAWVTLSCIHGTLGDSKKAVWAAEEAFKLMPEDTVVRMALSFAYLFDRQFAKGYETFEVRYQYKLHNFLQYPYPKWEGEPGKIVYLVADQGLGDTLSYARFVEMAAKRSKFVHVVVQPELMRVFASSFMHLSNINLIPFGPGFQEADCWTTFVSLPYAMKLTDDEVRNAPPIMVQFYDPPSMSWKNPDAVLHVGVAWAGSKVNLIDKHRSFPVKHLFELVDIPGVQLYSLQVGEDAAQLHQQGGGALIRDLAPYIRDVNDTFAFLNKLDLVITCESALGHMAAACNVECWIPYSYLGRDYRIGSTGKDMIWTPRHQVFRQGPMMQWDTVFSSLKTYLTIKVEDILDKKKVA